MGQRKLSAADNYLLQEFQDIALCVVGAVIEETIGMMRSNPDFLPESALIRAAANVRDRIRLGDL